MKREPALITREEREQWKLLTKIQKRQGGLSQRGVEDAQQLFMKMWGMSKWN